ncbi:ABC-three component system middle component 1 [Parabacteroides sp. Marseille-P3160]|uniref:ABC-three component system middle component 1 n=1 Tax=Parabacteroides sp. Marseille-P3160 TaxID=1917887 RepID=UPI0009BAFD3C|nr:ABC-three component system middle component 1 [Parabacteroides sp. Marseille-P3160]
MKTSLITEKLDFLDELYPTFNPLLSKIEFIGTVSVFSFIFDSENMLSQNWESITGTIASYYQSKIEDKGRDFECWNIYILFIVKEEVSTQLKYKIENDKFSSRKIVQDKMSNSINADLISQLIWEHIVNSDLDISEPAEIIESTSIDSTYSTNSKIYQLIENSNLKISGRGTDKEELDGLYQQIIKEISNEIQEGRNTSI